MTTNPLPSPETRRADPEHWAVTVEREGESVLTIATNCLSGRDLSPDDERVIRMAAQHLLSFVGASSEVASLQSSLSDKDSTLREMQAEIETEKLRRVVAEESVSGCAKRVAELSAALRETERKLEEAERTLRTERHAHGCTLASRDSLDAELVAEKLRRLAAEESVAGCAKRVDELSTRLRAAEATLTAARALAAQWSDGADWEYNNGDRGFASGLDQCASELEAALASSPAATICMFCDGCGWCEGSPAFTCPRCGGTGSSPAKEPDSKS